MTSQLKTYKSGMDATRVDSWGKALHPSNVRGYYYGFRKTILYE
jgi:hypothetical protein